VRRIAHGDDKLANPSSRIREGEAPAEPFARRKTGFRLGGSLTLPFGFVNHIIPAGCSQEKGVMDWKTIDHEYAKDFAQRMEALMPEPLYESFLLPAPKVCLVCACRPANSALYAGTHLVVPLCKECAADWNVHGYDILKRVRPKQLVLKLAKYKATHLFRRPGMIEIYRDVAAMAKWSAKMKAIMKSMSRP
jgi:hypothetical protein